MKKEYVKPQNRVVVLKGNLLDGDEAISYGGTTPPGTGGDAKEYFNDESDSSSDVWED